MYTTFSIKSSFFQKKKKKTHLSSIYLLHVDVFHATVQHSKNPSSSFGFKAEGLKPLDMY